MITTNAALVEKKSGAGVEMPFHIIYPSDIETLIHQPISQVHWQDHSMQRATIHTSTACAYRYTYIYIYVNIDLPIM